MRPKSCIHKGKSLKRYKRGMMHGVAEVPHYMYSCTVLRHLLPGANPGCIFTEVSCGGHNPAVKRMTIHAEESPRVLLANGIVVLQKGL